MSLILKRKSEDKMSLRAVASLQSMLPKSPLSCKSSKVHSGCSATQRKACAFEGRPEAAPKFFRTFCCHSSSRVILGKTGTRTVSDSLIGVVLLTESADSGCEGIGIPSLVGSVRTGDTWR
eukprot:2041064-Pyramimonas_sp.AAC.1